MGSQRWEIRSFTDGQHFKVVHDDDGADDGIDEVHDCVNGSWVVRPGESAVTIEGELVDSGPGTGDVVCSVCAGRRSS